MIAGPRTVRALEARALLDHDPALDLRVDELAVDARLDVLEDSRLASSMSSSWPVSFHQPLHDVRLDPHGRGRSACWIASVISSSPRHEGSIARAASKITGVNM